MTCFRYSASSHTWNAIDARAAGCFAVVLRVMNPDVVLCSPNDSDRDNNRWNAGQVIDLTEPYNLGPFDLVDTDAEPDPRVVASAFHEAPQTSAPYLNGRLNTDFQATNTVQQVSAARDACIAPQQGASSRHLNLCNTGPSTSSAGQATQNCDSSSSTGVVPVHVCRTLVMYVNGSCQTPCSYHMHMHSLRSGS
jgi:hypothetical protein